MSDAGGLISSWIAPSLDRVLHGQHREPVGDEDEHEQRDRQRKDERRDLHADRGLDLVAQLNRDRLPEQLDAVGNAGRCHLGAQEECERKHDHGGDRGGQHRVEIDREAEPVDLFMMADLNAGFGGQDRLGHCSGLPFGSVLGASPQLLHDGQRRGNHQQYLEKRHTEHHAEALAAGRRTRSSARSPSSPDSRVAEFTAILRFSGWSAAVIDSTERCTRIALSKPSPEADAEENSDHRMAQQSRRQRHQAGEYYAYSEQP